MWDQLVSSLSPTKKYSPPVPYSPPVRAPSNQLLHRPPTPPRSLRNFSSLTDLNSSPSLLSNSPFHTPLTPPTTCISISSTPTKSSIYIQSIPPRQRARVIGSSTSALGSTAHRQLQSDQNLCSSSATNTFKKYEFPRRRSKSFSMFYKHLGNKPMDHHHHQQFSCYSEIAEWLRFQPLSILQLDPADRVVLFIADERDAIQKKTFTKWVNKHLIKVTKGVVDLFEDLKDGNNLISLLETLSGEILAREKGKLRVHHLQNVQIALEFLKNRRIKLVNIRPDDIVDGNPKLTLGLVWTIILHFQLSDIFALDNTMSFKEALLKWARKTTEGYPDVNVTDFTHSWKDGLAFNAILHRNRPDLLDYRLCRGKTARQNLEHAFNIAERELGVTKLLDPEDVDCPHPDEKSLITYISSLYEVFPEPPENNPLLDRERMKNIEGYKKLAENLVSWMKKSIHRMNDRNFPSSLKEMKKLQQETAQFRTEEIPPRYNDKQLLVNSYQEILKMALALPVRIEEEYKAESIEKQWKTMLQAIQEKDRAIKEHMFKLEDLENIADKLKKNIRECNQRLDDIQYRVTKEEKRVHKVDPLEPNPNIDAIKRDLAFEEERISSMLTDARYLVEEKYPNAKDLLSQVNACYEKYKNISLNFQTKVLDVLEERRAQALRRPMTEEELIATNSSFRFLHECIEWVKNKQRKLSALGYGTDLLSVQKLLEEQKYENQTIDQFQSEVDKCDLAQSEFTGEEFEIYQRMLQRLHKHYSELKTQAKNRLDDLDRLLSLLKDIAKESKWAEDVIAPEIVRNWSIKDINFAQVEDDHRRLYNEIKSHESNIDSIVAKGERIIQTNHPAAETIVDALNELKFKNNLLVEMFKTLDKHKSSAFEYSKYHKKVNDIIQAIQRITQKLNTTYSIQKVSLEEGKILNKEMLLLKEEINKMRADLADLEVLSKKVSPLKLRTNKVSMIPVTSLVRISSDSLKLVDGEQLTLIDNKDAFNWKVQNRNGDIFNAPNLCFLIPPPDKDALNTFNDVKRQYEDLNQLWADKDHELRQNMLLAYIRSMKNWDYPTYCSMDPKQIKATLKALEDDIDKIVRDSKPGDKKSQQLLDEFNDLKKKFDEYDARLKAEKDAETLQKLIDAFVDDISGLMRKLQEKERIIVRKFLDALPKRVEDITPLVLDHKSFETDLKSYEPEVEEIMRRYASISFKDSVNSQYQTLIALWKKVNTLSKNYLELLKSIEIVLRDNQDATNLISELEINLSKSIDAPADLEQCRKIFTELQRVSDLVRTHKNSFDKLLSNVSKVRTMVEKNRGKQASHLDVDRLEEDVKQLHKRWNNIDLQVLERIKTFENCIELLRGYRSRMDKEVAWVKQINIKCDEVFRRKELSSAKALYEDASSHKASIEDTKTAGNRFMKEAKIFDLKLKNYREQLEEYHPSIDASAKRTRVVNGVEIVGQELKQLEEEYNAILNKILALLNQLQDDNSKLKEFNEISEELIKWLIQKEKQLNELGPICSEPRTLANQLQQIKRMKDDFVAQASLLNKMDKLGDSLLERLDSSNPEVRRIKTTKNDIHSKWDSLKNILDDRERDLLAVKDAAGDFQNKYEKLITALHKVNDEFERVTNSGAPNEEQLLKLTNIEEGLQLMRSDLADCESACDKLCSMLTDNASKNEVKGRVGALRKMFDDICQKISDKKAQLQSFLSEDKEFDFDCEAIQKWIRSMQSRLSKDARVSALLEKVTRQMKEFEPVYKEVLDKEHEIHILISKGNQIQRRVSDSSAIRSKIDSIKKQYDSLKTDATNQHTKLKKCLDNSTKYNEAVNNFVPWLSQMESKIKQNVELALYKQQVEKMLRDFNLYKNEISRHENEFETVCQLGETLISSADIDTDKIRDQINDIKRRWNDLHQELAQKLKELDNLLAKLANYTDKARDLNNGLNRLDDKLGQLSDKDPKQLDKVKALLKDSENLKDQLDKLKKIGNDLIDEAGPNVDSSPIRDELNGFDNRYNALNDKLNNSFKDLEKASDIVNRFNLNLEKISQELKSLEDKLDKMKPPSRTIQGVESQIEEMHDFIQKLANVNDDLQEASKDCERIISQGYTNDPRGLQGQLDVLKRKHERLSDRSKGRLNDLEGILDMLKNFYRKLRENFDEIQDVSREVESFQPISRDVDTIRSQQKDFQNFNRQRVEPLVANVNAVNDIGNDLIQSAPHGVNTADIQGELEKHNEKWNQLKSKLDDRERKLEMALFQAGRFKDALNGVEKWLTETEEMVANQKPPSSDYIVLKAQLQEQNYLKKTLVERQHNIDSLQEIAKELMANLDKSERGQIENQLANIVKRFNALMKNCDARMNILESALPVAKEFSDKLAPLQDWLDSAVRKLASLQSYSIEADKLKRRIDEHKEFHDDVNDRKKDFRDLTNIAQKLIQLVGNEEEGRQVTAKLTQITDKYSKLVDDSNALGKELQDVLQEISQFIKTHDELSKWIKTTDESLDKLKPFNIELDQIKSECKDLKSISSSVKQQQPIVAEFVQHGQNLVRQFSSKDSMYIRNKIDTIQSKFNDVTTKTNEKNEQWNALLAVAQKFYPDYNELNEWMDKTEEKLNRVDSLSLSQQNTVVSNIESEVPSKRKLLENVKNAGLEFARLCQGQGSSTIKGYVSKCVQRFDAICDLLQRKNEKLASLREQNQAIQIEVDDLFDWFKNAEKQLLEAGPIVPDREKLLKLLQETKKLNDEINNKRSKVRDVVNNVKRLMRDNSNEELSAINSHVKDLKELSDRVSQLAQDRLNAIEHALPFVEHFFDTHNEIVQFLDEVESEVQMLAVPSIYVEQIRKQQEKTKQLIQAINDHKPLIDKLNKTGDELQKLLQRKSDVNHIQKIMDSDNDRYNKVKNMLREHQNNLDQALQDNSKFSDKLDGMLNALMNTYDQLKNAEPISAHVPKIKEQINDNNSILEDLRKREDAFNAVKSNAKDIISKAGKSDEPAIRDIRNKLDKLNTLWDDIHKMANDRRDNLDEALRLATQFWNELAGVMRAIKELEDTLNLQEPPAVVPEDIKQQQRILKEIKHDMDQTKPDLDNCKKTGKKLMKIIGEQDKPEVRKHLEDLDSAWDNVTSLYARREQNLIDAMDKAMNFHEKMNKILKFLDDAENKFSKFGPIGADIDDVKRQIADLKNFKNFVDPQMVEVEGLNRLAHELLDNVPPNQGRAVREGVANINGRWNDLLKAISDRQKGLDKALLKLGQFQHSLNELLAWIAKVEKILDESGIIYGDPQVIEVELAKHKVLMNDIHQHQANVDSLNHVGKQLIDSEIGSENARSTMAKLDNLNKRWSNLIDKANKRTGQLEDCLKKSQMLAQEIQDMLAWLNDIDGLISTSKPVGGLPETAREQLNRFMEVYNELDGNRHKVEGLLQNGNNYVDKAKEGAAEHLKNNLKVLKSKWENILSRANDRKIKLEIALKEATEFHEALQEFVDWLTSAEKYLSNLQPVSRVLDNVLKQIEEHKQFQKDIGLHRETMLNLDKKGTHLKYFSQKQDVILIKNLLTSVQHRWERVVTKAAERARNLDHGFKEAKEFYDSWSDLIQWLDDADRTLDNIQQLGNNPDLIKQTLYRHKEFQRQLGAKQSSYDSTMRFGKSLKDKAPKVDLPILQDMLDELKNKWNAICQKSVDKQRKLEEALLFSGQFKEAIQALIEWLDKAKRLLAFDQPVHGDLDTVKLLQDQHTSFVEDFKSREDILHFVRKTANDLIKSANPEDARQISQQMETVEEKWKEIEQMSRDKKIRLDEALKDAERLHQAVHTLLEWLSDAEYKLRFAGPLPESEEETQVQIAEHERFLREMQQQEVNKNSTLEMSKTILDKSHNNAIPVIKHWIVIIQSRWDEVESWARQRSKRLNDNMKSLKDASELLNELMVWLNTTENELVEQETTPLPDNVLTLEKMIEDHSKLVDELNDKQVDVERVVKAYSSKKPSQGTKDRPKSRNRSGKSREHFEPELKNPKANELIDKFTGVCRLSKERGNRLKDSLVFNREIEKAKHFDFDDWRRRFLFFMEHKKAKLVEFYKKLDSDNDGKVSTTDFIEGLLASRFPTNRSEMERVADVFDQNGDRIIDQKEYLDTLKPDKEGQPKTESEIIQDEVQRQVGKCTCSQLYKVTQVGEGKYKFGNSEKLRLVRILRSTVMVRVGGGWVSLDEFLVKNDPCRVKGRTNVELRENYSLASGVSQSMSPFKSKSPYPGEGPISSTGPISKIREKTERSIPMSQGYRCGSSTNDSSDQENDILKSRARYTPNSSRPSSRSNSRPASRQSSQPPSRAASDMSAESLDGFNKRRTYRTGIKDSNGSGLVRTPSFTRQTGSSSSIGPRWK